ncbi:MAG: PHP domain-containing protein, partial [Chloroflexi bacterium]|nr:PHP domain-containing protein [Chloroflexota bacterium]
MDKGDEHPCPFRPYAVQSPLIRCCLGDQDYMRADLHIHTTASDGCWPPERVVSEVKARSIGLFAITDHDTVANLRQTEALARDAGLAFLRGVEVNTWLDGHLFHILAYGFEPDNPTLAELLRENRGKLDRASDDVIHNLIAAGYPIDLDDYLAYEYDRTRGGWKAYNYLLDRGFCTDIRGYFDNLETETPASILTFPHPAEAIAAIREASGTPILAHPGASLRDAGVTEKTLQPFLDFGVAGLECYHIYNDEATTRFCLDWCAHHDLLVTGGSDCHGGLVGRELGIPAVDTADLRLGELE